MDPALRPTPRELLEHEWVVRVMTQEVNMARWVREVWGWPKQTSTRKTTKESYVSFLSIRVVR